MKTRLPGAATAVLLMLVPLHLAGAQERRRTPPPGATKGASAPESTRGTGRGGAKVATGDVAAEKDGTRRGGEAATAESAPEKMVSVTTIALQRDAVKTVADQMRAANPKPQERGFAASLRKTLGGDKSEVEAAKRVLGQVAQSTADTGTTVIVVIGTEADRDKVVESLSRVQRKVLVEFVDHDFADNTSDNTVLKSGVGGRVTDGASNMWLYLPRHAMPPRAKPNQVLSSKAASATLWNMVFAADGDALDVDQLTSLRARRDSSGRRAADTASAAPASTAPAVTPTVAPPGAPPAPAATGGWSVGDVLSPKIANVKVYADASAESKVLGTVSKTDELVVVAAAKNGFVRVEGASVTGWISVNLATARLSK
jgi:hypothetical protein